MLIFGQGAIPSVLTFIINNVLKMILLKVIFKHCVHETLKICPQAS